MSPDLQEPVVINDDDELYKRLAPELCDRDGHATSGVYKLKGKPDPEPSVDLKRLTTEAEVLSKASKPGFGLGVLIVKDAREIGFVVEHRPEGGNYAHCILAGENTIQKARLLAAKTKTLVLAKRVS